MLAMEVSRQRRVAGPLTATLSDRDLSSTRARTPRRRRRSTEPLAGRIARALSEIADDLRRRR
jgi:hypothetical protein